MSFVHCHACEWTQDDFWSWKGYNPIRFFFTQEVPTWIRPQMVNLHCYGGRVFSWYVLGHQFVKWCRRLCYQKWWTYNTWRNAVKKGKGGCPMCGSHLCID
jgi:hypothetical protein